MATNSFKTINYHHHSHRSSRRRHSLDCSPPSNSSNWFLKSTNKTATFSYGISNFALSSTVSTTTPSTSQSEPSGISYDALERHLAGKNFRQADEETRRLIIALAGDAAVKRGYVFFSEVQFIPESDLRRIDSLWREHSEGRFGYSVQKQIWNKVNRDFTKLFLKLGWMKKLDTEIEQYNYRAFPDEFTWEISGDAPPDGHLPLTNALRGTQLLNCILTHPAFAVEDEGSGEEDEEIEDKSRGLKKKITTTFKPNYTF